MKTYVIIETWKAIWTPVKEGVRRMVRETDIKQERSHTSQVSG